MMNLVESILSSQSRGVVPVIAEFKRTIPLLAEKEGRPPDERPAGNLARTYADAGACGISLVAEAVHFGGRPEEDVPAILQSTCLPLLIKDFILAEGQVDFYARCVSQAGEDNLSRITLLLLAHRLGSRLPALLDYIHSLGMLALVETRAPGDLSCLGSSSLPALIGINNKNIDILEKDEGSLKVTPPLIAAYRQVVGGRLIISESALRSPQDAWHAMRAGADAVLVGTAFMVSPDPGRTVASFVHASEGLV